MYGMSTPKAPRVFVQYKNTKICLDFWCECGAEGHYDGYFANNVHCPACGGTFSLPYSLDLGPANEGAVATIRLDEESDQ